VSMERRAVLSAFGAELVLSPFNDEKLIVDDDPAFETTRRLAVEEGLFVGMSSGAAVAGAIQLARRLSSGTIVALLPDRGDRYLSTSLFRSTCGACPP